LADPVAVLIALRGLLTQGAIGFIEVPNGRRSFANGRFFDVFPDHLQHYSATSLANLGQLAGFRVLHCGESFEGDYLEAWYQRVDTPAADASAAYQRLLRSAEIACVGLRNVFCAHAAAHRRLYLWGAGAKGLSILTRLSAQWPEALVGIRGVIDSDSHKFGRYIPNTGIPILLPSQLLNGMADTVVILALSYIDEITELIRRQLPVPTILVLRENGIVQELTHE
jgi:hypothetical protein